MEQELYHSEESLSVNGSEWKQMVLENGVACGSEVEWSPHIKATCQSVPEQDT